MQLILVKIKWHIKWKYLIQIFHDICLSYYFKLSVFNLGQCVYGLCLLGEAGKWVVHTVQRNLTICNK